MLLSSRIATLTLVLLVASLSLIGFQLFGPKTSFLVSVQSHPYFDAADDRTSRGASRGSTRIVDDQYYELKCKLKRKAFFYPYCQIGIEVELAAEQGIDLSIYSEFKVNAFYENDIQLPIKIKIRNFDPEYDNLGEPWLFKSNAVQFTPNQDKSERWIPMSSLQVETWWVADVRADIHLTYPEFDNVYYLEISVGDGLDEGTYLLDIESIEFRGNYISNETIAVILGAVWGVFILGFLAYYFKDLSARLKQAAHTEAQLRDLNNSLSIKSVELTQKILIDELTQVYNRVGLKNIFSRLIKNNIELSVVFIDIDHFKKINDGYGHDVGDLILIEFCKLIKGEIRVGDTLARWGGEEFILVCENTNESQAIELSEKIRKKIEERTWPEIKTMTASFGVSQKREQSIELLIKEADEALYYSKNNGRNRVCSKRMMSEE